MSALVLLQSSPTEALDVATPVTYTALLMTVEFVGINALDLNHNSISTDNFRKVLKNPAPREDDDGDVINLVLHPLMGSETYLRARESDFGIVGSIAFSMAASITWEYAVESWTEHPSINDILATTGIGWLIGELRHQLKKHAIANKYSYFWVDPVWSTLEYFNISLTQKGKGTTTMIGLRVPL